MNTYISTIITVSVISGIISSVISSINDGIKKQINYIIGLICVIVLLSPIISIVNNATEFKNSISNFFESITTEEKINDSNEIIVNTGIEKICQGVKESIVQRFGFDEKEVIVDAELNDTNINSISISKINVVLTGKASWSDVDTVKKYLEDLIGCDASVTRK